MSLFQAGQFEGRNINKIYTKKNMKYIKQTLLTTCDSPCLNKVLHYITSRVLPIDSNYEHSIFLYISVGNRIHIAIKLVTMKMIIIVRNTWPWLTLPTWQKHHQPIINRESLEGNPLIRNLNVGAGILKAVRHRRIKWRPMCFINGLKTLSSCSLWNHVFVIVNEKCSESVQLFWKEWWYMQLSGWLRKSLK